MGGAVKSVTGAVSGAVKGAVNTVKDVAKSDLGKAALLGAGAYYAAPYLMGTAGAGTAGAGVLDLGGGIGIGEGGSILGGTFGASTAGGLLGGMSTGTALGLGAGALALGGGLGNKPTESTSSTAIDPDMKAAYLRNLTEARATAGNLGVKQFADFSGNYTNAEQQLRNIGLGGVGQTGTAEASRLTNQLAGYTPDMVQAANAGSIERAMALGYTPQQIQAAQANRGNVQNVSGGTGAQFMSQYMNPYEDQVVQAALSDVELARQRAGLSDRASATAAKAFGGSRQGVAEALTNEAAIRNASSTAANLRSAGFNTAAGLGQTDAARLLQAQMANQGVDLSIEQANAQLEMQGLISNQGAVNQASQFGAGATNQANLTNAAAQNQMAQYNTNLVQQANLANQSAGVQGAGIRLNAAGQIGNLAAQSQNLGIAGANAVMTAEAQRQALEQAKLDAARNLSLERLGISQAALGIQPAKLGETKTEPIYTNTGASILGGALGGAKLGSMIGTGNAGYGALAGGLLGLLG